MATDNVNTIDYLKHIYEQKVKHNEREQATLLASKQEKEDRVAQRRLEFLSLANEVVAEDMKHNKAAESTKILKGKSKKLMAEYVDAMTEISLLEAEMECLQNHSAVEQKLSAALDVHVQTESSVEEKRGALENALHIFKHKREEMAVKKAKLTRKFDDETQECMKMVAYCDTAQNKISSWVAVPTILQSSAHKANMHEAVCYLNEKIVECRDELTGYCKHKLITCKRKQRMIQDQYKEYLIQQEIRRNGGTLEDENHHRENGREEPGEDKSAGSPVHREHPLAEKDPKEPTIIANGVAVPVASLDLDTLEELCNMERVLLNTSLPAKHLDDDLPEGKQMTGQGGSKLNAIRKDVKDSNARGGKSESPLARANPKLKAVAALATPTGTIKRKQSLSAVPGGIDQQPDTSPVTSPTKLMTAAQKRAHRRNLSKQLSGPEPTVASFDFESEESTADLIEVLLEMSRDEGQLEHALSLKQGLETHILALASALTKSYDYLNSKYPEHKREYYEKQMARFESQRDSRYEPGASTVFMNNIHQNNGEGKTGAATGSYERVRKISFHTQKLTKDGMARAQHQHHGPGRRGGGHGVFAREREASHHSNSVSSSNMDEMGLQRHTWKYAQRLFDESVVLETDIRQLQFLTKYNLGLKHPTLAAHHAGAGAASNPHSAVDDDDLIEQMQLVALRGAEHDHHHSLADSHSHQHTHHGHGLAGHHPPAHAVADLAKTVDSIDTDNFADAYVHPTGISPPSKKPPLTRTRSSTEGDPLVSVSAKGKHKVASHSSTGFVSGFSERTSNEKGDHSIKGDLGSEVHLQHMMHNTHALKHVGGRHNHHIPGKPPSGPFVPPRIITNETLYYTEPTSHNVTEAEKDRELERVNRAEYRSQGPSRATTATDDDDGLGLGEQKAPLAVTGYLEHPLLDVGSDLPQGEQFRQLMEHVQTTEYKMYNSVQEPVAGSKHDYRLIDIPIPSEMFVVKLASTVNDWKSGSTPEQYEELIAPLLSNSTERRLNSNVGGSNSNTAATTAKDRSFYRSEYVKPVNSRNPTQGGQRAIMPRLSICVLTEL